MKLILTLIRLVPVSIVFQQEKGTRSRLHKARKLNSSHIASVNFMCTRNEIGAVYYINAYITDKSVFSQSMQNGGFANLGVITDGEWLDLYSRNTQEEKSNLYMSTSIFEEMCLEFDLEREHLVCSVHYYMRDGMIICDT